MAEHLNRTWAVGAAAAIAWLFAPAARAQAPTAPAGATETPAPSAHAEAPAAPAAAPVTPTPTARAEVPTAPAAATETPATATTSEAPLRLVAVTAGGGLSHASDDRESSAQRGSAVFEVAVRPGGAARGLEITAGYNALMGSWDYVQKNPRLDGSGPARASAFEARHQIGLDVRYDVLRLIRKGLPVHLSPLLGLGYVRVDSPVFVSGFFGGGGGGALGVDLDPRTSLDATFSVLRGFANDGGQTAMFGPIVGLWSWGAGVSLGATDWSRLRAGYVGEALDRASTTRFAHGARLSFTVSFL